MRIVQDCEDLISPSGQIRGPLLLRVLPAGGVPGRTVSERERRSFIVNCACSNQAGFGRKWERPKRESAQAGIGLSGNGPSGNGCKWESHVEVGDVLRVVQLRHVRDLRQSSF